MQFSTFSRLEEELIITLYNEIPIENVGSIINYSDNSQGTFNRKEIRWSFDSNYWSAWQDLTQNSISQIDTHNNYYFFIQVRYILSSSDSGTVSTFTLNYNIGTSTPYARDRIISSPKSNEDADTLNGYLGSWYLERSHHRGYQPISSITGLQTALNNLLTSFIGADASIVIIGATYIPSASLGSDFIWNNGIIEVRGGIGNYATFEYVDGSLFIRDVSVAALYDWNNEIDASINFLFAWDYTKDASIVNLRAKDASQDVSIATLDILTQALNVSINELYTSVIDIDISTDLSALYRNQIILADTSLHPITIKLPESILPGTVLEIVDHQKNSRNNNITIDVNSHLIDNSSDNFIIDVNGASIRLVYTHSDNNFVILNIETLAHIYSIGVFDVLNGGYGWFTYPINLVDGGSSYEEILIDTIDGGAY